MFVCTFVTTDDAYVYAIPVTEVSVVNVESWAGSTTPESFVSVELTTTVVRLFVTGVIHV